MYFIYVCIHKSSVLRVKINKVKVKKLDNNGTYDDSKNNNGNGCIAETVKVNND